MSQVTSQIQGNNKRRYWGQKSATPTDINLIKLQIDSYNWFLQEGIGEALNEISPVGDFTGKNWLLELGSFSFGKSKYSADEAKDKGVTFDAPLKVETILTNKQTGAQVRQNVFLGD